ncbi:MAG: MFS transporter [Bacteroidales bacterium]|jgi:FHS family L-fucose permease-like MFS transporter|nr:MFS transporter [Bacteroidales bacterium]MBQ3743262.1 MFS transporter [Bacteroidales bacterium]MBQ5438013.1 MFS transporter [Bacteroidales bacterium]MBR3484800.1 MFS transporter [Bacteroidales bacterium]MBR6869075.1 MFS transporter [Bacteroidales bacterium]
MTTTKQKTSFVPILVMIFLFGMISFVTNLAAPIGNIWKMQPQIAGSNALGMMGNMMNFLAYAIMGIPAGNMLTKFGYKKTALIAIAVGFFGVLVQFLSGVVASFPANFIVYLLGAFISGFSVCMLNTVVNPMLKLLGGRRSNQYIQIGGSFNSLMGTLTPMLVGALIGTLTAQSKIADVNPVLFIAMGVFAAAFVALLFIPIEDPEAVKTQVKAENPMNYRHFVYGVIAIFLYVGVEVGIPGTLNFFLSDSVNGAGLDPSVAVRTAGFVAGTYWFLMLIGRLISSFISGKVSSRAQLITVSTVALILVLCAMFIPVSNKASMPAFTGSGFSMVEVPLSALLLVLVGLCTSVMWGTIFDLAVEGLGAATNKASGIFMAMVVGGGILPLLQNFVADKAGYMPSYWVIVAGLAFIFFFAVAGSRVVKKAK